MRRLTRLVRYGCTRVLAFASLSSTAFAVGLAWAPNAHAIAALWILTGLAWAAVMPIQQAAIAEASGANIGRGMGIYESASLIGALLGTAVAGAVYDRANWVGVTGGMINLGGHGVSPALCWSVVDAAAAALSAVDADGPPTSQRRVCQLRT
ncbi:MFS transporter [Micromonospora sp. NPDC005173]|uniref:MFS transporter n=1 Tax=Micromonospora sp. NPDC005173 TaxID=3157165 RepID=UPI0033B73FCD